MYKKRFLVLRSVLLLIKTKNKKRLVVLGLSAPLAKKNNFNLDVVTSQLKLLFLSTRQSSGWQADIWIATLRV